MKRHFWHLEGNISRGLETKSNGIKGIGPYCRVHFGHNKLCLTCWDHHFDYTWDYYVSIKDWDVLC